MPVATNNISKKTVAVAGPGRGGEP
jgi:hypothetical protein